MSLLDRVPLARSASVLAAVIFVAAGIVSAQSISSSGSASPSYSSSQEGLAQTELAEFMPPAFPARGAGLAPAGSAAAAQYGSGGSGSYMRSHNWTFEAGGGFNAPVGNDTPYITWGGNFTVGGGLRLTSRLSALLEYQFMDNKLPGAFIAAANYANSGAGITGGNAHINSITASPVFDLTPKSTNGIYLVGGWGFYHKSTNFSAPEAAFDPFYGYYYANVTVASFTSNQWGGNAGVGLYHRLGGSLYGVSGSSELFLETRYTYLHTPPLTQVNGLGTTELIPVTFGIRF